MIRRALFEPPRHVLLALMLLGGLAGITMGIVFAQATRLPYDRTHPVVYDNDEAIDVYTDDYLMALASARAIRLRGMITSSTTVPFNQHVALEDYERMVRDRVEGVLHARQSGFRSIPDPVRGPSRHLERPVSGRIEDTRPIDTPGSRLIVAEAHRATPEVPLVLVMGGPLTAAADGFLLSPSIADRVVVAWLGSDRPDDMGNYNGWADPWAAYIVLQKLRLVMFHVWKGDPIVPKARLPELRDTPLRTWMIAKELPAANLPGERDGDGPPAISLTTPGYVTALTRVSFDTWVSLARDEYRPIPGLRPDPNGRALVATVQRRDVATAEWWRAMKNPAAYGGNAPVPG